MSDPDGRYTQDDHVFRDQDPYAAAKYDLTLRWLRRAGVTGGTLANVGCGGGLFNQLAANAGFQIAAFEPDPDAFELARARHVPGCTVENQGLFQIDPDLHVDVAVMHDVLEHIDAEAAAVDRFADLVVPGGIAVVSVPALEWLFGFHDVQLGHFRRYSKTSLARALDRRFEIQSLRYFGASMVPVALWFSRIKQRPYPTSPGGQSGLGSEVVRRVLAVESRVGVPLGTSVLALARRR